MSAARKDLIAVERLEDYRVFDAIIDVRSPAEFAEDHIPGAQNYPVLNNTQRVEVGTLYQQHSPFEAKKIGAAYVAENIAQHLRYAFHDQPPHWKPLIVCWRGGQRSAAMTLILRRVGWDAKQLQGGYKDYRKEVVRQLAERPRQLNFKVLCGATGSGKSRLLQALAHSGQQILDLEELACHKGSALGALPDSAQPSQKAFETQLLSALLPLDPARPVFVEAESRTIGRIHLPNALLDTMRAGSCLSVAAPFAARVNFLLNDYAYFLSAPNALAERLEALSTMHSKACIERWQSYAEQQKWRELVSELLEQHYDPQYLRSQKKNFARLGAIPEFHAEQLNATDLKSLAQRIVQRLKKA